MCVCVTLQLLNKWPQSLHGSCVFKRNLIKSESHFYLNLKIISLTPKVGSCSAFVMDHLIHFSDGIFFFKYLPVLCSFDIMVS